MARGAVVVTAAAAGVLAATPGGQAAPLDDVTGRDNRDNRDRRIDVHQHCTPPTWLDWAESRGLADRNKVPWWAHWDANTTLSTMDEAGIATAVVSLRLPQNAPYADDAQYQESLRVAYDALAELAEAHPGRFAFLAQAYLDNLDRASWSAQYGREAGAVGVELPTHDGQGRYLGDPVFDPLLTQLDAERTVAMVHPVALTRASEQNPDVPGLPSSVCDYLLATTRAAINMMMHRTLDRFGQLSFVLVQGGGFLPYISARVARAGASMTPPMDAALLPEDLRRFHYDTAAPMSPHATPTLLATAGAPSLLYGTDWPYSTSEQMLDMAAALDSDPALTSAQRARINRGNALALFPSLG
ncbi:putative metal-dependent hydrolase, TIM-barrel fold [Goodfellowiella coeruleoviolacea]|uniref:Metal-dependent hydrolase, TIM-barrel fold n=1 Tax=Goodfellowiella coeruleoviolacea TaxID=334858 RepID=A0AAE3GIK9_9PSEU|nr:putative metal-dependent hydrolase, TIM-barrel fold [Goodfellowiella coeruleoviolacea]